MEIVPNVHVVTSGQGALPGLPPPNVYLVIGTNQSAFIDTGYGHADEIMAQLSLWDNLGKPDISTIILTHRHIDHIGGANRLHQATGGQIVSSTLEKGHIDQSQKQFNVGRVVDDGEILDLGNTTLEIIYTPGHTLGSICVYYLEKHTLFTGDTILGSGPVLISPEHGDMTLYIQSLHKLLSYNTRKICPGHGSVINQPRTKIKELIDHRLNREQQVHDLLKEKSLSINQLLNAIYPNLNNRLSDSARRQILSHLLKLEREGIVSESKQGEYELK